MSTPTTAFPVPLELIEAFIAHLAPGHGMSLSTEVLHTLFACSLTSRFFSSAARKRLFSTLILDCERRNLPGKGNAKGKSKATSTLRSEEEVSNRITALLDLLPVERMNFMRVVDIPLSVLAGDVGQKGCNLRYLDFTNSRFASGDGSTPTTIGTATANTLNGAAPHVEYLNNLPTTGKYEICCNTDDGTAHVVDIDTTVSSFNDAQRLYQILSHESVHSSLRSLRCAFGPNCEPLFASNGVDLGTMPLLHKLAIESRVFEDIPKALTSIVSSLHSGPARTAASASALEDIKLTVLTVPGTLKYRGPGTFDLLDFSSLKGLRKEVLRESHPMVQRAKFCMVLGLVERVGGPVLDARARVALEERVRGMVENTIGMDARSGTGAGADDRTQDVLFPQIHICMKGGR